jgi:hypothetical protein
MRHRSLTYTEAFATSCTVPERASMQSRRETTEQGDFNHYCPHGNHVGWKVWRTLATLRSPKQYSGLLYTLLFCNAFAFDIDLQIVSRTVSQFWCSCYYSTKPNVHSMQSTGSDQQLRYLLRFAALPRFLERCGRGALAIYRGATLTPNVRVSAKLK